jgi:hypothetical protein
MSKTLIFTLTNAPAVCATNNVEYVFIGGILSVANR